MSTNEKDVPITPVNHAETAQTRLQEIRLWSEQIPRFVIPPTSDATRRLTNAASVSPVFIELTNTAVTSQRALAREDSLSPAEIRDLVSYADAYSPIPEELEALAHWVRHSIAAARNKAGTAALTTYSLARRLSKLPEHAKLVAFVADMRRALGRVRKLTPEEAAKKATERAAKAAAKVAKAALKSPAKPVETQQQPQQQPS